MRISQLNTIEYITYNFGGVNEVQSSSFYNKFLEFLQPPYHLLVVKPWSGLIDVSTYGLKRGEYANIYDENLNHLSTFYLPKLFGFFYYFQDYYLTQEGYRELERYKDLGVLSEDFVNQYSAYTTLGDSKKDLDPYVSSNLYLPIDSYINNAKHGEFFVVSFFNKEEQKQVYLALWVCRKMSQQNKENLLNLWRTNKSRAKQVQRVNQILIDFEEINLQKQDLLELNIVAEEWNARLTRGEVENHTDVSTIIYDTLDKYLYIYPNTDWWITLNLIRGEEKKTLGIKSKEGIGMDRIKEYLDDGSYFIQNYKIGGESSTATRSLFQKRPRLDKDTIKGVIKVEER